MGNLPLGFLYLTDVPVLPRPYSRTYCFSSEIHVYRLLAEGVGCEVGEHVLARA